MENVELTEQEAQLIQAIRTIDKVNPIGADGYSAAEIVSTFLRITAGMVTRAEEAYKQFLKESAKDRIVDLEYYRAPRYEDGKHIKKRG